MTKCLAYIRVSTVKQGEKGVSLQEQRGAIEEFARRNNIEIVTWFQEQETAAKRGRPAFTKMLALLRQRKADGVVIHKIDRGARNLRDWADLGELIDSGIAVFFANDSLDLTSRGGRLSADIQAVVAADYIRNLREETKKGINGRLKQGLLPMGAPLGYLDHGGGRPKTIDPERGPLIKMGFELYATGKYSLRSLTEKLYSLGLRSRAGTAVWVNSLSLILNNPFYMGIIRIKRTGEVFSGVHEPLVSPAVFAEVQRQLKGKRQVKVRRHEYLFRGLFICSGCGNHLVGETQRGHVYYRCHTPRCPLRCAREEALEEAVGMQLLRLQLSIEEREEIRKLLRNLAGEAKVGRQSAQKSGELRLGQLKDHLMRLTDAYLQGDIEKPLFEERKRRLLSEEKQLEETLRANSNPERDPVEILEKLLERADGALLSYFAATQEKKRDMLISLTSNRALTPNGGSVELVSPFSFIANRASVQGGCPARDTTRSRRKLPERKSTTSSPLTSLIEYLLSWINEHPKIGIFE
jgi:site-specific DNA recombinase